MKKIENRVSNCQQISWKKLKTFEFNDLKDKDRDISKLKNSIINEGFCFPFYLWKDHQYVIDGNGRNIALNELESEGYKIPDLPVVEIEANSKQHAKKLVLMASSQYGKVTKASYDLFIEDIDLEIDDIELQIDDDNYFNLHTDTQDIINDDIDDELPIKVNNSYTVILQLDDELHSFLLCKNKSPKDEILKILRKAIHD